MTVDTNLQKAVITVEGNPKLDKAVKELLADKQVLARILKRVTDEFKDSDYDSIMAAIEGEPEIESVPVETGMTNSKSVPEETRHITGEDKESNIQGEGTYYFDVKFSAHVPDDRILDFGIRIIVDVEGQYDYYPGYDIVTRGVFYGARMISSQSGTEFLKADYSNLRKVYSIWICMDPPDYAANSIIRFGVRPEVMYGNIPEEKIASMKYDLMDVVLVNISTEKNTDKDELCGMLEVLLDENKSKEDRLGTLEKEYGMRRTVELEKEMDGMCDYSVGIARKNFLKGLSNGEEKGIEKGQNILVNVIQRLRNGESREDIIKSGVNEKTVDLAEEVK